MHSAPTARLPPPPWWVQPDRFIAFIILPLAIVICLVTPRIINGNHAGYDAPIFLNSFYTALFLSGIALVGIGAFVGMRVGAQLPEVRFRNGCLDFLFWTTLGAYAVWFGPLALKSPDLLLAALRAVPGAADEIKDRATLFSGVTTATQFGISYCCIWSAKQFVYGEAMPRRYAVYFAVIVIVAGLRAVAYSERIALVEVVFPALVMLCRGDWLNRAWPLRVFRQTLPLLMIIGSPVFFTLFEYNRSWIVHYQYVYDSLASFGLERLGIYYATALNNISGWFSQAGDSLYTGEITFRWLYRFPVIGDLLSSAVGTRFEADFLTFLEGLGIKEFNNTTGIIVAHVDWGVFGGSVFLFVVGFIAGRAFDGLNQLRGFLQYFYPSILYSLFEILRIGYFVEGRFFAALIGLAIAYVGWGLVSAPEPLAQDKPLQAL